MGANSGGTKSSKLSCLCVQLNTLNAVAYLIYLYFFNFLRLFSSPWKVNKTALEIFLKLFRPLDFQLGMVPGFVTVLISP